MPKPDSNKIKKDENLLHGIDPEIEKKVDKMMDPESKDISSTAPLLPGDKLPDFSKAPKKQPAAVNKSLSIQEAVEKYQKKTSPGDSETDKAVDEIASEESDRMLAIEDAKAELLAEGSAEIDRGFFSRLKAKWSGFWHNRKARWSVFLILLFIVIAVAVIPTSRYFALNLAGVRASASFRVVDEKTNQPLKNVEVGLDDKSVKTDKNGKAKLDKIKLGPHSLYIKKPAFADINQKLVIGWGSNPQGDVKLTAVGSRYSFNVKDFVSDKAIKAEAVSGDASATANENGDILLVVPDQQESDVDIALAADNYRTENFTLPVGDKNNHEVKMVPSKKIAFVSKRSGKYDLYKVDADGKNEEKVLAGTGNEVEDRIAILPHPKKNIVAYVSTRGEQRTKDGYALSSLSLVNLDDNEINSVDVSERIQLVNFIDSKLVYVKIAEGESAESPNRHRLVSYDIQAEDGKEIANANYFNDVLSAGNSIFYAPSAFQSGEVGLYKINPDGTNKTTIYDQETWNILRVAYDKIDVSIEQQKWYEYNLSNSQFSGLSGPPPSLKSRVYADSPDGQKSVWIDERDGKGVLLVYDVGTKEEKVINSQSGLKNPVAWLDNDHVVYRVSTTSETADYIVSLSGGQPKKIKDVTNTAGLDRWYYY